MEFEYTGTIYIDTDEIFEICCDDNRIDTDEIYEAVNYWIQECHDPALEFIEGWMVDEVVTTVKKRIDKALED